MSHAPSGAIGRVRGSPVVTRKIGSSKRSLPCTLRERGPRPPLAGDRTIPGNVSAPASAAILSAAHVCFARGGIRQEPVNGRAADGAGTTAVTVSREPAERRGRRRARSGVVETAAAPGAGLPIDTCRRAAG